MNNEIKTGFFAGAITGTIIGILSLLSFLSINIPADEIVTVRVITTPQMEYLECLRRKTGMDRPSKEDVTDSIYYQLARKEAYKLCKNLKPYYNSQGMEIYR